MIAHLAHATNEATQQLETDANIDIEFADVDEDLELDYEDEKV